MRRRVVDGCVLIFWRPVHCQCSVAATEYPAAPVVRKLLSDPVREILLSDRTRYLTLPEVTVYRASFSLLPASGIPHSRTGVL